MLFRSEAVVYALAGSRIPTISAIGHETDTTLSDFAADVCAPTPTAAAELAVPVRADLIVQTSSLGGRLFNATLRTFKQRRERVSGLARGLRGPRELLDMATQRVDHAGMRLERAQTGLVARYAHRLDVACRHLRVKLLREALTHGSGRLQRAVATVDRDVRRDLHAIVVEPEIEQPLTLRVALVKTPIKRFPVPNTDRSQIGRAHV